MDNKFKLAFRALQKDYPELKDHWLKVVYEHCQSVKSDVEGYEAQIKHFLGVK